MRGARARGDALLNAGVLGPAAVHDFITAHMEEGIWEQSCHLPNDTLQDIKRERLTRVERDVVDVGGVAGACGGDVWVAKAPRVRVALESGTAQQKRG